MLFRGVDYVMCREGVRRSRGAIAEARPGRRVPALLESRTLPIANIAPSLMLTLRYLSSLAVNRSDLIGNLHSSVLQLNLLLHASHGFIVNSLGLDQGLAVRLHGLVIRQIQSRGFYQRLNICLLTQCLRCQCSPVKDVSHLGFRRHIHIGHPF